MEVISDEVSDEEETPCQLGGGSSPARRCCQ